MQERVVLGRAPMAAEQGVRADEVDGAGDPAPGPLGHHQQDALAHRFADREKNGRVRYGRPHLREPVSM